MESTSLEKTDLSSSRVWLGTMTFGAQADAAAAGSMLDLCLERGVNLIDTANAYNGGETEKILGNLLQGRRQQVTLATKVGLPMGQGQNERGLSRAAINKALDDSLRRLRTDYVDLYYLHQPDYSVPIEESLAAMQRLVEAGKVRSLGASNYASWQVCQMLCLAKQKGWTPVSVVQPMYNLLARGIEQDFLPMSREFGLTVVAYNPLAGGLLTGKHRPDAPLPGTRFDRMPAYRDRYWHPANFAAVDELSRLAREAGRSLAGLALGWLVYHRGIAGVILGALRLEQLQENLAALDAGPLAPETLEACERVWETLRVLRRSIIAN